MENKYNLGEKKTVQQKISELKRERFWFLQDYKMGLRQAGDTVKLIDEIDRRIAALEEEE